MMVDLRIWRYCDCVVAACMRTRDGRLRVYIYQDQTAELVDKHGVTLLGRVPLYEIGRCLAELGVAGNDLEPA
jgi:hypothetical protein